MNIFKITFRSLKLLKRQACLKGYYFLFTQLTHCGRKKKDSVLCSSNHSGYLSGLCFIILFYELVLVVH